MTSRLRPIPRQRHLAAALTAAIATALTATALIAPAAAPGAVTVGQTAPGTPEDCGLTTLFVQAAAANPSYEIPAEGVITSWSAKGGSGVGSLKLKVVRRTPPTYTIVGEDTQRPIAPGVLNTFSTRIPVAGGELLALWVDGSGPCTFDSGNPGDIVELQFGDEPEPGIGQSFAVNTAIEEQRVNVNATVEPDCDSDGFGDETQDPDTLSCNPDRTLTLESNKGKVEKGFKVLLSGQIDAPGNEAGCEPNQTIELQKKRRNAPESALKTFKTLETNAAGNFGTKVKVVKTRFYRATVQETAACDGEVSNMVKVRVQSKHAAQEA